LEKLALALVRYPWRESPLQRLVAHAYHIPPDGPCRDELGAARVDQLRNRFQGAKTAALDDARKRAGRSSHPEARTPAIVNIGGRRGAPHLLGDVGHRALLDVERRRDDAVAVVLSAISSIDETCWGVR